MHIRLLFFLLLCLATLRGGAQQRVVQYNPTSMSARGTMVSKSGCTIRG